MQENSSSVKIAKDSLLLTRSSPLPYHAVFFVKNEPIAHALLSRTGSKCKIYFFVFVQVVAVIIMGILSDAPKGFTEAVSVINSLPQGLLVEMVSTTSLAI